MDQVDSSGVSGWLTTEEFPAFSASRIFIAVWIKARQWFLFWTTLILLTPAYTVSF
jgi:hypothetical protein